MTYEHTVAVRMPAELYDALVAQAESVPVATFTRSLLADALEVDVPPPRRTPLAMWCSVDECGAPVVAKALCSRHYARNRRTGNPLVDGRLTENGRGGVR